MPCNKVGNAIICTGGKTLRIKVGGNYILFEMHPFCGPMPVDKNDSGITLKDTHPFWGVVADWVRRGQQVFKGYKDRLYCVQEKK